MIDALIQGKVLKPAKQKSTSTGNSYCYAMMTTSLKDRDGAVVTQAISVMSFNQEVIDVLMTLSVGDAVALAGELSLGIYGTKDGSIKPSASLVAHHVTTAYHITRRQQSMQKGKR